MDPLSLQEYSYFVREVGLVDDKVANHMKHLEMAVKQFINEGEMIKAYAVSILPHIPLRLERKYSLNYSELCSRRFENIYLAAKWINTAASAARPYQPYYF